MLSSLLETLKSQFTSKSYWLGSMMPLVLFLSANAVMFKIHSQSIWGWINTTGSLSSTALTYSAVLAVILAAAYMLSGLTSLMLEVLEGKHFLTSLFFLHGTQWRRLDRLDASYRSTQTYKRSLQPLKSKWLMTLETSREVGSRGGAGMSPKHWISIWFSKDWRERRDLAWLCFTIRHGLRVDFDLLERIVASLAVRLSQYDSDKYPGQTVDYAHDNVIDAIQYAGDWAQFEIVRLANRRQFHFPGTRPSAKDGDTGTSTNRVLAPTKMGNIGRTMRSYALTRYQLDLDIFWTRLQYSLQKDGADYFKALQDTKAQVDCMVTLVWLSAGFTAIWTAALLWVYPDSRQSEFRVVGIGGALVTAAFYWLACQIYGVFADVMRSAVDLFRFNLLQSLRISQPYGSEEERALWVRLGNLIGYETKNNLRLKAHEKIAGLGLFSVSPACRMDSIHLVGIRNI